MSRAATNILDIISNQEKLRQVTHARLVAIDKANGVLLNSPLGDKEKLKSSSYEEDEEEEDF